jgi:hypothetical protein
LENGDLAMYEIATGKPLLSQEEWANQETQRAEEEKRRAEEAERRLEDAERRAKTFEEEFARLGKKVNGLRRKNCKSL